MLKIRGKIHGDTAFSEVVLHNGQLEGDTRLVLLVKRLSAEWEALGVVPAVNYFPETDEFWKDKHALMFMMNDICVNVQTNQKLEAVPEPPAGADN